jgi:phosphotransferase system enzyme I (PtsI)/phosphotransferase system enzyme I (PtsP)
VIDAYRFMLEDPQFNQQVVAEINNGTAIPGSVKKAVFALSEAFKAMSDPYLQARHEDIEHLGQQLYELWLGDHEQDVSIIKGPTILVGRSISVSMISKLYTRQLNGIVCYEGASLSHVAVFANALGIPAVMGVGKLTISEADTLIIDGDAGEVVLNPDESLRDEYQRVIWDRQAATSELLKHAGTPTFTSDQHRVALMANSGLQSDIAPGLRNGAEGIGLYRTELPFMVSNSLPSEQDQQTIYEKLFDKYRGKPVYIRTLDIGSDKALPYLPVIDEENPALGLRGIRFLLNNIPMLKTQLRAIFKASKGSSDLYLVFPMIGSTEQLDVCLELTHQTLKELREEGYALPTPKIGIMVEVPSCIPLLPFWRSKLDFVSVGSNDLSQYLLAIDRNNALVSKWFDPLHPSILMELNRIAETCKQLNLPFSICGELAANPIAVVYLVGMGCTQLSMSAAKLPIIKHLISHLSFEACQHLLSKALTNDKGSEIARFAVEHIRTLQLSYEDMLIGTIETEHP